MAGLLQLYPSSESEFPTNCVTFLHPLTNNSQPFWGNMCAAAGAGPPPIPQKELTTDTLSEAIKYCLSNEAAVAAAVIAQKMQAETGVKNAARYFHQHLPTKRIGCDVMPHLPATFRFNKGKDAIRLSSLAAELILQGSPKDAKYLGL